MEEYEIMLERPSDGALIVQRVMAWSFEHARQKARSSTFKKWGDARVIGWRKAPPLAGKTVRQIIIDDPEAP